jgi:hypothetical protein
MRSLNTATRRGRYRRPAPTNDILEVGVALLATAAALGTTAAAIGPTNLGHSFGGPRAPQLRRRRGQRARH